MNHAAVSGRRKARKIRYHEHEWDLIVSHARACGLPPATFVRKVSLGAKPRARRNRTENELIFHLGRMATDLHQLAHLTEQSSAAFDPEELQLVLDEVLVAIRRIR